MLTLDRDVVLTAGAGTGKTRTLVARVLHLLAQGVPARNIFAVTFTVKAAREMRNRLRKEITAYLAQPELAGCRARAVGPRAGRPGGRSHRHHSQPLH